MFSIYTTTFRQTLGVKVIESPEAYEVQEDWSRVRSPGRAARRRRCGHRQNIALTHKPLCFSINDGRTLIVHPQIAVQLRKEISARLDASIERQMSGLMSQFR